MSQHKKLERILDLLVNEEADKAEELLHNLVVEKARNIYEGLVNEEDEDDDDMDDEVEESIGGGAKQDFMSEVEADKDDIEADELQDGEVGDDEDYGDSEGGDEFGGDEFGGDEEGGEFGDEFGGEEMPVEDKVEDLEAQLAELRAEFEQLMGDEMEEPYHDEEDFAGEYGDEMGGDEMEMDMVGGEGGLGDEMEEAYYESRKAKAKRVAEATKLQDNVPDPGMSKEGKLAGTGKHSKSGATGTESPYTKAPTKSLNGAKPTDFTKGAAGGEYNGPKGGDSESAKDDTPSSNIDVTHKQAGDGKLGGQTGEGKHVGTGKGSKSGATQTKSPLSTAPKHP